MSGWERPLGTLLVLLVGCSSSAPSAGGKGSNGDDGGDGGGSCIAQPCACADGRTGTSTACGDPNAAACDCSACPEFQPSPPLSFTACGGDPSGLWNSVSEDLDPGGPLGAKCPAKVIAVKTPPNQPGLMLDLVSGGGAALALEPSELDFAVPKGCVGLAPTDDCGMAHVPQGFVCHEGTCGVCDCTATATGAMYGSPTDLSASWSRTGTQLNVGENNAEFTASYCVQGSTLTLVDSTGVVFHMQSAGDGGTDGAAAPDASTD